MIDLLLRECTDLLIANSGTKEYSIEHRSHASIGEAARDLLPDFQCALSFLRHKISLPQATCSVR